MKKLHKSFVSKKETVESMNAACYDLFCTCNENCKTTYEYTGVPSFTMQQRQYDVAWDFYN